MKQYCSILIIVLINQIQNINYNSTLNSISFINSLRKNQNKMINWLFNVEYVEEYYKHKLDLFLKDYYGFVNYFLLFMLKIV